jgi:oligoendopeptidase F
MKTIKNIKTEWDLTALFKNDNDPAMAVKRKRVSGETEKFVKKWKGNKAYLNDPKILKQALDDYEKWNRFYGPGLQELYYFTYRNSQDQLDKRIRAKLNQSNDFAQRISNEMEFFYLSLGKISKEKQKQFLKHEYLENYRHFLEKIFSKAKYFLSEAEEKILNLKQTTSFDNWVMMTEAFLSKEERMLLDEDGKKRKKNFNEISALLSSHKKAVRDGAAAAFNEILKDNIEIAEHEINSVLQDKKVNDGLRGFERPDSARHIGDDVSTQMVDALDEAVKARFDISARFYRLKAKLLGVKRLKYHERMVEYGKVNKRYTYEEALHLTLKAFNALDAEFGSILEGFVKNRQIDAYPHKGKTGGAYCSNGLITQPTYILLNFTGKLNDVLTIAHEAGHGINSELTRKKENAINFGHSLAVAEVASTFMEGFVLDELLRTADDELRLKILIDKLGDSVSTIQRQIACYNFEKDLHQAFRKTGYLPKEEIGSIFKKNMEAYMGGAVEQSAGSENWWVYWSHIRSYFYVYTYASGLLIAKSLQRSIKKDPTFVKKVKKILSVGLSASPKDIFAEAGIDITKKSFWDRGLEEIDELLVETEKLAKKLKKI